MPDVEKVIKALENLREYADSEVHPILSPDNWGMYSQLRDLIDEAEEDALVLLKAQEPCLLTWDELIATDHVYIETNKDGQKYIAPGIVTIVRDTAVIASVRIGTRLIDGTIDKDVYGIEYRCWTSRPTDEQREATPWNL